MMRGTEDARARTVSGREGLAAARGGRDKQLQTAVKTAHCVKNVHDSDAESFCEPATDCGCGRDLRAARNHHIKL